MAGWNHFCPSVLSANGQIYPTALRAHGQKLAVKDLVNFRGL